MTQSTKEGHEPPHRLDVTLFFFCALMVGCFKDNPAHNKKDAGPSDDLRSWWDGGGPDGEVDQGDSDTRSADLVPWPDQQPWPCTQDSECKDPHDCTEDRCDGGKCTHTLSPDRCLIGLKCYKSGQFPPGPNNCQVCDADKSTNTWTVRPDGATCHTSRPTSSWTWAVRGTTISGWWDRERSRAHRASRGWQDGCCSSSRRRSTSRRQ